MAMSKLSANTRRRNRDANEASELIRAGRRYVIEHKPLILWGIWG